MDSIDTSIADAGGAVERAVPGADGATGKQPTVRRLQPPGRHGTRLPAGRVPGIPNRVTRTIRDAVELACQPGACHPKGLAGWLVERATSRHAVDRQIFAGLVAKALPLTVNQNVSGGIAIQLGWLQGRGIGAIQAERIDGERLVALDAREIDGQVVLSPAGDATERGERGEQG